MGINQFSPTASPLDRLATLMGAISTVYGIKKNAQESDLLAQKAAQDKTKFEQEQKLAKEDMDPNSARSQFARATAEGSIGLARANGLPEDQASAILSAVKGSQTRELPGPVKPGEGPLMSIARAPMTAQQINAELKNEQGLFGLVKADMAAKAKVAGLNFRDDQLDKRQDFQAHKSTVNAMMTDKTVNDAVTRAQNMANVINNVEKTGVITPQDMHDIQSIAIMNMGVQSGGGVHERAKRYAETLGLKSAEVEQFLTGKMKDIGQDNPLYQRYKEIMNLEAQNFKDRVAKRLDSHALKFGSVYARNPEYSDDLNRTKQSIMDQMPAFNNPSAEPQGGGGGMISSAHAGAPDKKLINGATYIKVNGGWKKAP